jgi:hypothetical protein
VLHGFWRVTLWNDEKSLVEFGFPGPRLLHFSDAEWRVVLASARALRTGEIGFKVQGSGAISVLQRAVDLGYLVPDNPNECDLPDVSYLSS